MTQYPALMKYRPARWAIEVTAIAAEPLSLADLKAHARVETADEDALLTGIAAAARDHAERHTGRAIAEQTRVLRMSGFPDIAEQYFELPGGAVRSVTSITYVDADGVQQTLAPADYEAAGGYGFAPPTVQLTPGASWPDTEDGRAFPVAVTYEAGNLAVDVPPGLMYAIKMIAADMYERREAATEMQYFENRAAVALMAPYKMAWAA